VKAHESWSSNLFNLVLVVVYWGCWLKRICIGFVLVIVYYIIVKEEKIIKS
jgi:hypothetical protein